MDQEPAPQPLPPAPPAPPMPAAQYPPSVDKTPGIRVIERVTVWVMVLSAILFAFISVAAIWGLFGHNAGDTVGRSLGTLGVIAFAALVVNVGANILDRSKKK